MNILANKNFYSEKKCLPLIGIILHWLENCIINVFYDVLIAVTGKRIKFYNLCIKIYKITSMINELEKLNTSRMLEGEITWIIQKYYLII